MEMTVPCINPKRTQNGCIVLDITLSASIFCSVICCSSVWSIESNTTIRHSIKKLAR